VPAVVSRAAWALPTDEVSPMRLSTDPFTQRTCTECGTIRVDAMNLQDGAPVQTAAVSIDDFDTKQSEEFSITKPSISAEELERYAEWTELFGVEG